MLQNVIKVKLKTLLEQREKSLNSLARETNISYNTLHKLKKSDVTGITFDVMEKICDNLQCDIGDLLAIEK